MREHIKSATYFSVFITLPKYSGNVQKNIWCTRASWQEVSQGRRTVINSVTSKKRCHTDLSFLLLGPTTFLTSLGSAKSTHKQSRPEYSQHPWFLSRLFPLLSQELPMFNQSINMSWESVPDGPVRTLSTPAMSHWQYLKIHTMHHYSHCC